VHTSFGMAEAEMTKRIVTACEHPWIDAIGHPTGPQDRAPPAYAVDMHQVIEAAARTGTMLEINAAPDRRDLHDVHARTRAEAGVPILIDSDAHGVRELALVRWGHRHRAPRVADRRQVANTRPLDEFLALRKRARS
jgi:DNA polymerase (family 10)